MLKKSFRFKRTLNIFIFLLIIAVLLFSLFSFLAARTNVNILKSGLELIKGAVSGNLSGTLESMQSSLTNLYKIIITEFIVLAGGVVASLFAINYMVGLYFTATTRALVDELTGVYNRRAIYRILDQEIKRAERFKHPLTVIMMDIDYFKIYNDKNGHIAGDLLLQKISKIISNKIREVDTFGRYGGEEFLAILPETSHEGATKIAERVRRAILDAHFKGEKTQPAKQVTMSMGLVTFHGEYKNRQHLIHSADELLYRAKEAGRNQLIRAYHKNISQDKTKKLQI